MNGDVVLAALLQDDARLVASLGESAYLRVAGDAELMVTRLPFPMLNGVLTVKPSANVTDVAQLLDVVARDNIPYSLLLRPGCEPGLHELATKRGMVGDEPLPLMVLHPMPANLRDAAQHKRLVIRTLRPDEAGIHHTVAAAGFEAPHELFEALVNRRFLEMPGLRAYVGEVDGEPVTTALASAVSNHVGIFNVATPPAHRGKGYGAAVTARAALDGFDAGAAYAYLQSSPAGHHVYERLGFRTVETWEVWVSS